MAFDLTLALLVVATAVTGVLAGASLDQSVKQLPARRKIGAVAYSRYSRAADLFAFLKQTASCLHTEREQ
jgi:hypothetical protein